MSKTFNIRMGDRMPALAYRFPFPLTGALGVTFSACDVTTSEVFINRQPALIANGTYVIDGVATALSPDDAKAVVFYPWAAGDTVVARNDVIGLFHISWAGSLQETLPSEGSIPIVIGANF